MVYRQANGVCTARLLAGGRKVKSNVVASGPRARCSAKADSCDFAAMRMAGFAVLDDMHWFTCTHYFMNCNK